MLYSSHTLYMRCSHNADIGIDLPLHVRFLDASRHDSVSAIVSLREFKTINPDIPVRDTAVLVILFSVSLLNSPRFPEAHNMGAIFQLIVLFPMNIKQNEISLVDASPVCHMQDAVLRSWRRDIIGEIEPDTPFKTGITGTISL